MGDAQPHVRWPDVSFDFCIERLGTKPGELFYPVGSVWPGDELSWTTWRNFINLTFAPGKDLSDLKVRNEIRRMIQTSKEIPFFNFKSQQIEWRQNPNMP